MSNRTAYQAKVKTPKGIKTIGTYATEIDALTMIDLTGLEGRAVPIKVDFDPTDADHLDNLEGSHV
jgi:hypothetical protein